MPPRGHAPSLENKSHVDKASADFVLNLDAKVCTVNLTTAFVDQMLPVYLTRPSLDSSVSSSVILIHGNHRAALKTQDASSWRERQSAS